MSNPFLEDFSEDAFGEDAPQNNNRDTSDQPKPEHWRVSPKYRFFLKNDRPSIAAGKNKTDIVFLDSPELFNDVQLKILKAFGMHQGPFSLFEYNLRLNGKFGNLFTDTSRFTLSPVKRLLFLKALGAWYKVGPKLDSLMDDPAALDMFYMNDTIKADTYMGVVDDPYIPMIMEILEIPTGGKFKFEVEDTSGNKIVTSDPIKYLGASYDNKKGVMVEARAGSTHLYTIIDTAKFTTSSGEERSNTLKLFPARGEMQTYWRTKFDEIDRRGKNVRGLGGQLFSVSRIAGDKVPSSGNDATWYANDLGDPWDLNPEGYFLFTRDNILERLVQDHHFIWHRMRASGLKGSPEEMADAMLELFKDFDGKHIPRTADYALLSLPMSPKRIREKFNMVATSDDDMSSVKYNETANTRKNVPAEDDIPF